MRFLVPIVFVSVALNAYAQSSRLNEKLADSATKDAESLGALLSEDWHVVAKEREIVLTSKFEVFQIGVFRGGQDPAMPTFSDSVPRSEFLAHGPPKKYEIRLRYSQRLSQQDYEQLLTKRQEAASTLAFGARTKEEYGDAAEVFMKLEVPRYEHRNHHIYETTSDHPFAKIFPPSSVKKIGAARGVLAEFLGALVTASDPTTG